MLNELRKRMKIIKTCNLYLSLFTLGMAVSLTGPCLLDLQHMVHTDTQHIAGIYTARSTGYLLGAIIGGILLDFIRSKQAVLLGCNIFVTVSLFSIPFSKSVGTLLISMWINGFSLGAIETGGNVICLELWGKDSNPIFQGLHFTFALGGLISPLIAAPFLEDMKVLFGDKENNTSIGEELINSTANISSYLSNNTQISEGIPKLIYPFSIVSVVALLVTISYLVVCIISPREDESSKDDSKTANTERSFLFMFFTVIFMFLIFFVIAGTEIGYGQMLTTFAVKGKLHLTTTRGSYITSAFWGAFAISRLLCVFISMKISNMKLIIGDICLIAVAALLLLFLMPNEWVLWLASVIYGVGVASAYASLVGWINTHINITNKISAIFTVGCSTGEMIVPFVISYFIDTIPEMFCFVTAASVILTVTLLFILYCMFKKGHKVNESKDINCYIVDVDTKN